jgi:hypothetical protein
MWYDGYQVPAGKLIAVKEMAGGLRLRQLC